MLVHRCRFVQYQPSPVQCLALDRTGTRLAVGRENGAVELWNIKDGFYLDRTLWTGAAIRRVCFLPSTDVNSTNLIATIGLDGMLRMYDLNTLQVINQWQLGAGAIWDLTLLDEDTSSGTDSALRHSNGLVCSCDDGTVRIVFIPKVQDSYPINSLLPPQIILRTPAARLISVATSRSTDGMTRWIWTGSSEGKMYRFDLVYNDRTELGVHAQSSPVVSVEIARRVMPWCIKVLPEAGNKHTIAVGDSDGAMSIWDGAMGTRIQHLKHHGADIVAMCADPTGEALYCASIDAGVSMYSRSKRGTAQNQWVFVGIGRQHTHDVQAIVGNKTHLFSAGIDTTVYSRLYSANLTNPGTPLSQFGNRPVGQLFGGNRMLVQLHDSLQVWRLGSALTVMDESDDEDSDSDDGIDLELVEAMQPADDDAMDVDRNNTDNKTKKRQRGWRAKLDKVNKKPKRDESHAETHDVAQPRAILLEIRPQLRQNNYIACSAVSRTGDRIAMSDLETTRVFYIKRGVGAGGADSTTSADEDAVGASEDYMAVRGRKTLPGASLAIRISEAGQLVRATPDHQVEVYDLRSTPVLLGSFDFAGDLPKNQSAGPIVNMAVSSDAQWLAVGDANNNILIYNLDTVKFHGALPLHDIRHTCLAFQPGESNLAIGFVGNKILVYDIEQMQLTPWSKRASSKWPAEFSNAREGQIFDITFHPEQPHIMTAYSHAAFFVVDLSKSIHKQPKSKKSVETNNDASDDMDDNVGLLEDGKSWRIIQRYHPLLFCGFAEGGSLVVAERPFRSILVMLPPPFYRHRFAT